MRIMPAVVVMLICASASAQTPQYVVYLHGRTMSGWPPSALLGNPALSIPVRPAYNGSARLEEPATRAAVRNAMLAVALAQHGHVGGETVLEGPAGFYHAYAGNNRGQLTYSFVGDTQTSLDKITANLGKEWLFLETLYRIYSTAGYNIAHVDVTAQLCAEHHIKYEDVERVEAVVNWLETQYPSPAFPSRREDTAPRPGSTPYYSAYVRC